MGCSFTPDHPPSPHLVRKIGYHGCKPTLPRWEQPSPPVPGPSGPQLTCPVEAPGAGPLASRSRPLATLPPPPHPQTHSSPHFAPKSTNPAARTRRPARHRRARHSKGPRRWGLMERPGRPARAPRPSPRPNQPRSSPRRASSRPGRGAGGAVTSRWISRDPAPPSRAASAAPQSRAPPRSRSEPLAPGRAHPAAAASPSPATGDARSAGAAAEPALAAAAGCPASPPRLRPRRWSAGRPAPGPARDPASHWPPGLRAVHCAPPRGRAVRVSGPPGCHLGARLADYIILVRSRPSFI